MRTVKTSCAIIYIYKVPTGHQGRDSPTLTGALKEGKIIIIVDIAPNFLLNDIVILCNNCQSPQLSVAYIILIKLSLVTQIYRNQTFSQPDTGQETDNSAK